MKKFFLTLSTLFLSVAAFAQLNTPDASPKQTVNQVVGVTQVSVTYSRPSAKGRTIFGQVVPMGKIWRTGANEATTIEFSSDFSFGGTALKAGKYALYTIPNASKWEVFLYADTNIWGDPGKNYDTNKVVAKQVVTVEKVSPKVETFSIGFDNIQNNDANLVLSWENTLVKVPFKVNTREVVTKSIENTMKGISARDYQRAAAYYFEENIDLDKALVWAEKAAEMNPNAFWVLKLKSDIQAAKKDYKNAIKTAETALEAAKKAGNEAYTKMLQDNISAWKKM